MNFFSKLLIVIICIFALIFIKDNFHTENNYKTITQHIKFERKQLPLKQNNKEKQVQSVSGTKTIQQKATPMTEKKVAPTKNNIIGIYFTNTADGELKPVYKELPQGNEKLSFALKTLFSGPSIKETNQGYSSEIPKGTKLLAIKDTGSVYIIDVSDEFQYGGGTESQYLRLRQLIKTVLALKLNKPVYLYLNGKKAEVIGGEGILITQPLSENSLND